MKKILFITLLSLLLLCSCTAKNKSVVGVWVDTETEGVIQFTKDGYYKEGFTQDVWQTPTKYVVNGNRIIRYVENARQETEFAVTYEITDEGNLIINGILEYVPLKLDTEIED